MLITIFLCKLLRQVHVLHLARPKVFQITSSGFWSDDCQRDKVLESSLRRMHFGARAESISEPKRWNIYFGRQREKSGVSYVSRVCRLTRVSRVHVSRLSTLSD